MPFPGGLEGGLRGAVGGALGGLPGRPGGGGGLTPDGGRVGVPAGGLADGGRVGGFAIVKVENRNRKHATRDNKRFTGLPPGSLTPPRSSPTASIVDSSDTANPPEGEGTAKLLH